MKDPYEAQGSNLRVHHPVQPKTQVERWIDELQKNILAVSRCDCKPVEYGNLRNCSKQGSDNCNERIKKMEWLETAIHKDHENNKTYLNRHPTGTFADDFMSKVISQCGYCGREYKGEVLCEHKDIKVFTPEEISELYKMGKPCPFFKFKRKVSLLDKIKKLLQ